MTRKQMKKVYNRPAGRPRKIQGNREEIRRYIVALDDVLEEIKEAKLDPRAKGFLHIKTVRVVTLNDIGFPDVPRQDAEPSGYSPSWCYEVVLVRRW